MYESRQMLEITLSHHSDLRFIGWALDYGPGQSTQSSYFKNVSHSWKILIAVKVYYSPPIIFILLLFIYFQTMVLQYHLQLKGMNTSQGLSALLSNREDATNLSTGCYTMKCLSRGGDTEQFHSISIKASKEDSHFMNTMHDTDTAISSSLDCSCLPDL